jgi:hypothetical protein
MMWSNRYRARAQNLQIVRPEDDLPALIRRLFAEITALRKDVKDVNMLLQRQRGDR